MSAVSYEPAASKRLVAAVRQVDSQKGKSALQDY